MPFTFSHPAVILPFAKSKKLCFTGLIVGSMSPDFEYFLRMRLYGEYGHTLLGVWWLCLPVSILVCFLLHDVIKKPLIKNLPETLQHKSADILAISWNDHFKNNFVWIIISIVIGAYSHILLDSFTHHNGYFLQKLGWGSLHFSHMPLYKILQHFGTLFGWLVIVLYIIKYRPYTQSIAQLPNINFWYKCIILFIFCLGMRLCINPHMLVLGHLVVNIISIGFFTVTAVALLSNNE